jgi:hypothetical protein
MVNLVDLLKKYEDVERDDLNTRSILVLEMIEKILAYPSLASHTNENILKVDECVQQLVGDLRKDKQYLFSVRISKMWKKREYILQLAKTQNTIKSDYMDDIQYHEEIKWLRDERTKLIMKKAEN